MEEDRRKPGNTGFAVVLAAAPLRLGSTACFRALTLSSGTPLPRSTWDGWRRSSLPTQPAKLRRPYYQGWPLRSGTSVDRCGKPPAMRINATTKTPEQPPPRNATNTHQAETIFAPSLVSSAARSSALAALFDPTVGLEVVIVVDQIRVAMKQGAESAPCSRDGNLAAACLPRPRWSVRFRLVP